MILFYFILKDLFKINENPSEHENFLSIKEWEDFLIETNTNSQSQNESQILLDFEIILKKIEVVNIAQNNLSNYIDNLDYAINLYENKRASLIRRFKNIS